KKGACLNAEARGINSFEHTYLLLRLSEIPNLPQYFSFQAPPVFKPGVFCLKKRRGEDRRVAFLLGQI
ncbi:hypothetical protein, partial [Eubacterium maltosivorans]|uniref:hypothetical protein n=1 Tax=Eubacterium maltosivorans TaxID=2041044 RepID=UPI003A902715